VEWAHPEIEFVIDDGLLRDTWTGVAGTATAWRDRLGAFADLRAAEVETYHEQGEKVLVLCRFGGRGKTSELELPQVNTESACLFQIHGGKVARLVLYPRQRDRALADLGLAPEGDTSGHQPA
jgi:hypothetical protein